MHLLVIRTSAMGDVALLTPVLRGFLSSYPGNRITIVTRKPFAPFFNLMEGVALMMPDFKNRHKGLAGIFRLFRDINKNGRVDAVIDLHDVLRSKVLGLLFRLQGKPVFVIDKGRREKRQLTRGLTTAPLKRMVYRYCDVFEKAGYPLEPHTGQCIIPGAEATNKATKLITDKSLKNIGVAPFAKHDLKKWPEEYMVRLLSLINGKTGIKVWLFGGYEERELLGKMSEKIPGSVVVTGSLTLDEELALMSRLDLMIAMDSSNMHMASLVGTKVISIWGGTDPKTGFSPWDQPADHSVMIPQEDLSCRPCTVFGKGKCRRGDLACMNWLTPEKVYEKIINLKIL